MSDDLVRWHRRSAEYGWQMPVASWWKRLPVIRHARAAWAKWQIERWYGYGPGSIGLRTGYDDWVVFGIYHGLERTGK